MSHGGIVMVHAQQQTQARLTDRLLCMLSGGTYTGYASVYHQILKVQKRPIGCIDSACMVCKLQASWVCLKLQTQARLFLSKYAVRSTATSQATNETERLRWLCTNYANHCVPNTKIKPMKKAEVLH